LQLSVADGIAASPSKVCSQRDGLWIKHPHWQCQSFWIFE
jgi:hypothetical protein